MFLAGFVPWLIAIPFQTGHWLDSVMNWTSLVFVGVVNFILPFAVYLAAWRKMNGRTEKSRDSDSYVMENMGPQDGTGDKSVINLSPLAFDVDSEASATASTVSRNGSQGGIHNRAPHSSHGPIAASRKDCTCVLPEAGNSKSESPVDSARGHNHDRFCSDRTRMPSEILGQPYSSSIMVAEEYEHSYTHGTFFAFTSPRASHYVAWAMLVFAILLLGGVLLYNIVDTATGTPDDANLVQHGSIFVYISRFGSRVAGHGAKKM